ncbi:Sjogren's syndrome/scleroderma autoantigen 1 family protein [Haloplanus aerogenes]|uniref:Uncharacterized Zn finger protein (UPF0148 family) n=1 Tax=Haloplanus aerogenes TaxID=660522 RepID=A0A3M0D139_9EURY|nr:Sjogren's syndrome/scleroderma autoantigen 1 family protein [Haloplanus aerogenes]AZH23976.1 hypothetical protein DU502_00670 [Haloplanus aerogenes]RMB13256.1 uncharacterized Zn finger protein (UPF0148 family) [Haloplanus aerogenes]
MSGFDEEAERERLREKYEQDQEKRAATQRMSELLLKGATMTNSHCDTCGDPLFRYDGQTFCPTCQAADQEAAADAEDGAEADDAATPDTESTAEATPTSPDAPRDRRAPSSAGGEPPTDAAEPRPTREPPTRPSPSADTADLDDIRASLSRTLARYTRAAEETDDPRRAKELLAAAREAAETLAALNR